MRGGRYAKRLKAALAAAETDPLLRDLAAGVPPFECMTALGKKLGDCIKEELQLPSRSAAIESACCAERLALLAWKEDARTGKRKTDPADC